MQKESFVSRQLTSSMSERWENDARAMQQTLYSNLRDREWSFYRDSDHVHLKRNIGFALYGPPDELLNAESNENTGFSEKKREVIGKVLKAIKENDRHDKMSEKSISIRAFSICVQEKNSEALKSCPAQAKKVTVDNGINPKSNGKGTVMSVVFVVFHALSQEGEELAVPEPVFRVPNETDGVGRSRYIDRYSRVYRGWDDFLARNWLPQGRFCYPVDGVYYTHAWNEFRIVFKAKGKSQERCQDVNGDKTAPKGNPNDDVETKPNSSVSDQSASSRKPIFAGSKYFACFMNVILMMPDENLDVMESHPEKSHNFYGNILAAEAENDSIFNQDTWLSLDGKNLGMVAMGGRSSAPDGSSETEPLKISPETTNCYGIVTAAHLLHGKLKNDELTAQDVTQFSACVLFFTMSAIGDQAARKVIKEATGEAVNSLRSVTDSRGVKTGSGGRGTGFGSSSTASTFTAMHTRLPLASLRREQSPGTAKSHTAPPTKAVQHLQKRHLFAGLNEPPSPFVGDCVEFNLFGCV